MVEACDMRGFLSFIVLRLTAKKPMCGEELRKELEKRKGSRPSSGTIYPVLKSLSENGFIRETECDGKEKRYEITPKGRKELVVATKKFMKTFYDMKEEFEKIA